jgi:nanoRNase/pAp phosphatase (c-di-AMP/oligoRNAs hydrolase)
LKQAVSFRHLIYSGIGEVPAPEIVSEMADLLLRHKHISWVLCTGKFKDSLILSIRSSNKNAKAGKLIKKIVEHPDFVGGHDTIAGGTIPLPKNTQEDYRKLSSKLRDEFVKSKGYINIQWNPLITV